MAKGKSAGAQRAAEEQVRAVRQALRQLDIYSAGISSGHKGGNEPYWYARLDAANIGCGLKGDWFLTGFWRYRSDPNGNDGFVHVESSAGLNVANDPHAMCIDAGRDSVCVARYDYDTSQAPALHLNVLQPKPLLDTVHWRLPLDDEPAGWSAERVLRYLVQDTITELYEAGWPRH